MRLREQIRKKTGFMSAVTYRITCFILVCLQDFPEQAAKSQKEATGSLCFGSTKS